MKVPVCDKCGAPLERYPIPGTGGREFAWRLACRHKPTLTHSAGDKHGT